MQNRAAVHATGRFHQQQEHSRPPQKFVQDQKQKEYILLDQPSLLTMIIFNVGHVVMLI